MSTAANKAPLDFTDAAADKVYSLIAEEEKKGNHLYWNYDVHMKAQGYLWTGEVLFNWWSRMEENN